MDFQQSIMMLPGIQPEEIMTIQELTKSMTEDQKQKFLLFYQGNRKDPQTILLLTLLGFVGVAGIQRFVVEEVGMGVLYLITGGFCWIGTIIDLINHKQIAYDYNYKQAVKAAAAVSTLTN